MRGTRKVGWWLATAAVVAGLAFIWAGRQEGARSNREEVWRQIQACFDSRTYLMDW